MANKYLDDVGLAYFKDKNDDIYAGSLSGSGRTVTLTSVSGETLGNYTIPLQDLSAYALKTDLTEAVNFKGVVSTWANLPSSGMSTGDMYIVTTADSTHSLPANGNVIWTGSAWDVIGEVFAVNRIDETTDIDPLFE